MNCEIELLPSTFFPSTADLVSAASYAASFLIFFAIAELGRRRGLPVEITRKFVHLAAGILVAAMPCFFDTVVPVAVLALSFFGLLLASRAVGLLSSVHGVERRSAGAFIYPLSIVGVLFLSGGGGVLFSIPILVLAFSDAFAAVVGKSYGRFHFRIYDQTRSLEGSAAFFVTTFLVIHIPLVLSGTVSPAESLLIAFLLSFLVTCFEAIAVGGWDNVVIPVATLFALDRLMLLSVSTLLERVLFLAAIVVLGIATFRNRRFTVAALFASWLLVYGTFNLGGPEWALPLIVLYFTYNLAVPPALVPNPRKTGLDDGGDEDMNDIRQIFYMLALVVCVLFVFTAWPNPFVYGVYLTLVAFLFAIPYALFGEWRGRMGTADEGRGPQFEKSFRFIVCGLAGVAVATLAGWLPSTSILRTHPILLFMVPMAAGISFLSVVVIAKSWLPLYRCVECGRDSTSAYCHGSDAHQIHAGRHGLDFPRLLMTFGFFAALLYVGLYLANGLLAGVS